MDEFEIANGFVIYMYIDDTQNFHEGCLEAVSFLLLVGADCCWGLLTAEMVSP